MTSSIQQMDPGDAPIPPSASEMTPNQKIVRVTGFIASELG